MLPDNSIIPSYLGASNRGVPDNVVAKLNNNSLRVGEVKDIVYPDDQRSITKQFTEYVVEVSEKDGGGIANTTHYIGCVINNVFGGWADQLRYTLRKDSKQQNNNDKIYGIGSKVLLLCVNGNTDNAIIIGGIPDAATQANQKDDKNNGHNLLFEFNGLQAVINKDGELLVKFRGATNTDGTLADSADSNAEGSFLQFDKNGGIKIATKENNQFISINHQDKTITLHAQEAWNCSVNGPVNITATENVNIKSPGVMTGDATDFTVLGTTYRRAEHLANEFLQNALLQISQTLLAAVTSLTTAIPLNGIPVIGGTLATPSLTAAVSAISALIPLITAMSAAIKTLETHPTSYLSIKNKSD